MIRSYKSVEIIILLLTLYLVPHNIIYSQGNAIDYAGPDRSICLGSNTQIGSEEVDGACYSWTSNPPGFTSLLSNPQVSPTLTTTYTIHVVGPNFSYSAEDQVTVTVINNLNNLTDLEITLKKCCWKVGEPINADQFNITTNPSGLDENRKQVSIVPNIAPSIFPLQVNDHNITITVVYECDGHQKTIMKTISIKIVDENNKVSVAIGNQFEYYKHAIKLSNFAKTILSVFNKIPVPTVQVEANATILGQGTESFICCPYDQYCSQLIVDFTGEIRGEATVTCDWPIVPGLYFRLFGRARGEIGLTTQTSCSADQLCPFIQVTFSAGAGLAAGLPHFAEVSGLFIASIQLPNIKYCIPPGEWDISEWCYMGEVVVSAKFYNLYKREFKWQVFKGCGPFPF
jgi:hypothetical protein